MTGECAECDEKRLSVQRYAIGGTPGLLSQARPQLKQASALLGNLRSREAQEQVPIQTKLAVSEPGDKFELEADRIAAAVMRRSEDPFTVGEEKENEIVQTKLVDDITPLVQRQAEGAEEEEEEEEDETVQTKNAPGEAALTVAEEEDEKMNRLAADLKQARASGIPLPGAFRGDMEKAFGVDFSQVRIHADRTAGDLSRSLHASAFTTGTDLFFREGALDFASSFGRRLLAHELTHVVQQNPQLRMRPPAVSNEGSAPVPNQERSAGSHAGAVQQGATPEPESVPVEFIQRDDPEGEASGEPDKVYIGVLYLSVGKAKPFFAFTIFHSAGSPLKPGRYSATVTGTPPNAKLKVAGKTLDITEIDWDQFVEQRKKATRMKLQVSVEQRKVIGTDEGKEGEKDKDKPAGETGEEGTAEKTEGEKTEGETTEGEEGGDKEKGVEGGQGETTDKPTGEGGGEGGEEGTEEAPGEETDQPPGTGGGEKAPPQPPSDTPPPGEPGTEEPGPTEDTEPKDAGEPEGAPEGEGPKPDKPQGEMEVEGGVEGGKKGGTGKGTEPGSKYGWLGWIHPSQEVIDVLEAMFEALGDSEEFLALSELLNNLSEFDTYAGEMRSWFDNPDKLLRVALGLENSEAINDLEKWALKAPLKRRKKVRSPGRGLRGILSKILRLLETIRRILNPIFRTRARFTEALGAGAAILEEIPVFEQLLEGATKPGTPEFEGMLADLTRDFSAGIQRQLEAARAIFKVKLEKLTDADLITPEELALAIVSAARKALPPHARLGAAVFDKLGLLEPVSDNLVAPMIPDEILNGINGILKEVFSLSEPILKTAESVMDEVISTTESVLQEELVPHVKEIFMPQRTSAFARFAPPSELGLLSLMQRSRGEMLEGNVRRELESSMGFDFASVRIHHDFAAQRANQMVNANAFTVGSNIFFGPGTFAPQTDNGRHLLAHELTHVVQQGEGTQPAVIQRDAKGLAGEIAKKYAEFLKEAKSFRASPKKKAEAAEIRAQVEVLVAAGEPVAKALKKLPSAYVVVRKKRGKIEIRRKSEWLFLIPKLKVVKNKIVFGFLSSYDPKAAARQQLARSLRCVKKRQQAHHIVPLELRDHELVKLAEANGFKFNKRENGICLSSSKRSGVHRGSHPIYTESIRQALDDLVVAYRASGKLVWTADLNRDFRDMIARNRRNLRARKTPLR